MILCKCDENKGRCEYCLTSHSLNAAYAKYKKTNHMTNAAKKKLIDREEWIRKYRGTYYNEALFLKILAGESAREKTSTGVGIFCIINHSADGQP